MILAANSWSSLGDCEVKLLDNQSYSSAAYSLDTDLISSRNYGNDYLAKSIFYIRYLADFQGCSKREINFGRGPMGKSSSFCQPIHRDVPESNTCYVETNLGYFFVNYDLQTTVHIVFNLWD